jgi:hypothetical protein
LLQAMLCLVHQQWHSVVVMAWEIPVLFDSSNHLHRNINYHPDLQVTRKGKKRIAMMNISLKETWEFTSDGKIKSITGARA